MAEHRHFFQAGDDHCSTPLADGSLCGTRLRPPQPPAGLFLPEKGRPADRTSVAYKNTPKRTKMVPISEDEAREIVEKLGVSSDEIAEALIEKLKRAWAL